MKTAVVTVWAVASLPLAVIEAIILLTVVALGAINDDAADKLLDIIRPIEQYLFIGQVERMIKFMGY